MDLAQMLVVGGCAVIGASLGVTFWRVSQTALFRKIFAKKAKASDQEPDEPLEVDEAEPTQIVDEVIEADILDDVEDVLEPEVAEFDEDIEAVISDLEAPQEDSDGRDDFDPSEPETLSDDIIPDPQPEPQASDVLDSNQSDEAVDFQEKIVTALEKLTSRVGDAMDRLDRLEADQSQSEQTESLNTISSDLTELIEDIEISDLPISPAAEFENDEGDGSTQSPETEVVAQDDQSSDDIQDENKDVMEFAAALESEDEADTEQVAEPFQNAQEVLQDEDAIENPLDLPRVVGI